MPLDIAGSRTAPMLAAKPQLAANLRAPDLGAALRPEAWYILNGAADHLTDTSGKGHALANVNAPADEEGSTRGFLSCTSGRYKCPASSAPFRTAGAISVVALFDRRNTAGDCWFAGCEETGIGGWPTWWKCGMTSDRLIYAHDNAGAGASYFSFVSPVNTIPTWGWHVASYSRLADGKTVSAYFDGAYVGGVVSANVPQGLAGSLLYISQDAFGTVRTYGQQVVGVFLGAMTAAQHAYLAARLLGGQS